jgi:hypothetical protein
MRGVDPTRIDGIDVTSALVVVSGAGTVMVNLPGDKHSRSASTSQSSEHRQTQNRHLAVV